MDSAEAARAAGEVFREHGAAVYRFALVLLRRHEDAEDVVQETFVKLLHHLTGSGKTDHLRGWLFTVAAHAARDRQRRRRRWLPWGPSYEQTTDPPALPDEDGRLRAARRAIHRLPARDRLLLALRANGLSYREIAAAAGIKPASVGRLLARAVDRWTQGSLDALTERNVKDHRYGLPDPRSDSSARR
jgi:RNA polymerase sigma-70 factor, ECF subfamily